MKKRADQEAGYVLHTYPYKETSLIVELFTRRFGRIALLARGAAAELAERFGSEIAFGTAGLRGLIGAGTSRMNRRTVARTTAGLCAYLARSLPDAQRRGLCIGYDGRHQSRAFADEALVAEHRALFHRGMGPQVAGAADDGAALDAAMEAVQLALAQLNTVMLEHYVLPRHSHSH